jgi:hypothetical protein
MKTSLRTLALAAFLALAVMIGVLSIPEPKRAYAEGGSNMIQGIAGVGSGAGSVRPVLAGGLDTSASNLAQFLSLDANAGNALLVTAGFNPIKETETFSGVLTSNGTTAVVIQAGAASKTVYLAGLSAYNTSTSVLHTFDLIDSGGTVVYEGTLGGASAFSAGGNLILEGGGIYHSTVVGNGLSFKIDAGGSGTDVKVTAVTVRK